MSSIMVRLFEHHLWANRQLLAACGDLTNAQLDATVPGTAGTIRETLMHIVGAEQRYVARLSGAQPTYSERDGWPGAAALLAALDASGQALIRLVGAADAAEVLTGEFQGRPYVLPVATLYVQAINHATEHRSQIATILTQQGIEPPDVSAWAWSSA